MQCISCQFENLPELERCGRCGSCLNFFSSGFDVHPQRAVRHGLLRRLLLSAAAGWKRPLDGEFREALEDVLAYPRLPDARVLPRLLLPGGPQLALGRRVAGLLLLGAWLSLLAAVVFSRTPFWRMQLLGLLAFVRWAGVSDLTWTFCSAGSRRWKCSLLYGALLFMLVDLPLGFVLSRWVG